MYADGVAEQNKFLSVINFKRCCLTAADVATVAPREKCLCNPSPTCFPSNLNCVCAGWPSGLTGKALINFKDCFQHIKKGIVNGKIHSVTLNSVPVQHQYISFRVGVSADCQQE